MNYYISDLHIEHSNIMNFDNRPFKDVQEMNQTIVDNWNKTVKINDTVYILGDFIWAKENEWIYWVKQLTGNKVLVRGNHDPRQFSSATKKLFQDITNLKEIKDNGRHVIMCHYPIPFYRASFAPNCYMLYGHVHQTKEYDYLKAMRKQLLNNINDNNSFSQGNFINVGAMMPYMNYTPRTLDEIINGDKKYRNM